MFSFRLSIRDLYEGVERLRRTTDTSLGRAQEMFQDNQRHTSVVPRRMFNNYNPCGKILVFMRETRSGSIKTDNQMEPTKFCTLSDYAYVFKAGASLNG